MRSRFCLPVFTALALTPLGFSAAQAGSFFGPSCYGADYTYQYPNRSHNVFGCGPGTQCTARHPLFKHRWLRKQQNATADGAATNVMSPSHMATPIVEAPMSSVPIQTISVAPVSVTATPASRIVPIPAPLQSGAMSPEPPLMDQSGKPPF